MAESFFQKNIKARESDQNDIQASLGLEEKKTRAEKIYLSLPADCKKMFLEYCKEHHTTASAQFRAWIYEYCDK